MSDSLQELSQLSKDLQSRTMTVVAAHQKIRRLIVVLEARKLRFGPYYDTAKEAIPTGEFHSEQLMNGSKPTIPEILPAQFY